MSSPAAIILYAKCLDWMESCGIKESIIYQDSYSPLALCNVYEVYAPRIKDFILWIYNTNEPLDTKIAAAKLLLHRGPRAQSLARALLKALGCAVALDGTGLDLTYIVTDFDSNVDYIKPKVKVPTMYYPPEMFAQ